jgi:uncharacterized protein
MCLANKVDAPRNCRTSVQDAYKQGWQQTGRYTVITASPVVISVLSLVEDQALLSHNMAQHMMRTICRLSVAINYLVVLYQINENYSRVYLYVLGSIIEPPL